jgi:hypothetical protein
MTGELVDAAFGIAEVAERTGLTQDTLRVGTSGKA